MKVQELDALQPYRITKSSSDGTFVAGDIIWGSDNGDINSVQADGCINQSEVDERTLDFEAEAAPDFEVIKTDGSEICRRVR
mgnify:FL=1